MAARRPPIPILLLAAGGLLLGAADGVRIEGGVLLHCPWETAGEALEVPEGVTAISGEALRDQWRNPVLRTVRLPASLESLPECFWEGCLESLERVEVAPGNRVFVSEDGVLFSGDRRRLLCHPPRRPGRRYEVPEGVEELGPWCFRDSHLLEEVVLPRSLTSIRQGAFYDCRNLRRLTVPGKVARIGADAFRRWPDAPGYALFYPGGPFAADPEDPEPLDNPYGPPEEAAGTTAWFPPDGCPAEHFGVRVREGQPFRFVFHSGWNCCYLPEGHPALGLLRGSSRPRLLYDPRNRCYITPRKEDFPAGFHWLFRKEGGEPEVVSGIADAPLDIPADGGFEGWSLLAGRKLQGASRDGAWSWDPASQAFRPGGDGGGPDAPVWIPRPQDAPAE